MTTHQSFCRLCINQCAIEVTAVDGAVYDVRGAPDDPMYRGHTCEKGRSQGALLTHPHRLLSPLRRDTDGRHWPIPSEQALDEIAERILAIRDRHGPDAIAGYAGTYSTLMTLPTAGPMYDAFMDAVGSSMRFVPATIDKGGKSTAKSFLGRWGAPSQGYDSPQAILLIGGNPWLTYTGLPVGSPKRWLQDTLAGGCTLIVIDPRRTNVASLADWHLQARPGHDVGILAAMIKLVLTERWTDETFVAEHVTGVDDLVASLKQLDVSAVCRRAGIEEHELYAATRAYAWAGRGFTMAGTGPNMGGRGTLVEYLVLVLESLLGHWLRAGEPVVASPVLTAPYAAIAEATGPDENWGLEPKLRVRGLRASRAGVPTAALAEEMLQPGPGQIKALISWSGNPAAAFPDRPKVVAGLGELDLLVQLDPWFSETARLADYVIAPTMPLEVPASSAATDWITRVGTGYGSALAYGHYTGAVVDRPAGSDLLEEWEFFYGLLERIGGPMEVAPFSGAPGTVRLDVKPTTEEYIALMSAGSRIPLEEVRARSAGALYDGDPIIVQQSSSAHRGRLDVGHPIMLNDLRAEWSRIEEEDRQPDPARPFRLLCRRENHLLNSVATVVSHRDRPAYRPVFLNPSDMDAKGFVEGDAVLVHSANGAIGAIAHADQNLRPGVVSMAFAHGGRPPSAEDPGGPENATVNELVSVDELFDRFTGQPRMSNVPVEVSLVREP